MPKISFIYSTPKPWDWCSRCTLGLYVMRDNRSFEISLGLFFLDIGLSLDWGNNAGSD